jgi:hypothetical protein
MRALHLAAGASAPPRSLVVDCGLVGDATYSHWQGSPEPPAELRADSSTAMLLNAARDPGRWLAGFDQVVNDHLDADGLLAMAVACHPETALPHAELLIGAAEAGDFSHWPGEAAFRLMLRLHRHIADAKETGAGWQQRALDLAVHRLPGLIAESAEDRFAAVARQVQQQRVHRRRALAVAEYDHLVAVAWDEVHGHVGDHFLWTGEPDDLPSWVVTDLAGPRHFHLLAMTPITRRGTLYWLQAPGHSWARTVVRPTVTWPDLGALVARLDDAEDGRQPGRWVGGPAARRHGFVCQLTRTDASGDALAPSSLPLAVVSALVEQALAAQA